MSSLIGSSKTNNNTTDDEENRINILFPKCKLRNSQSTTTAGPHNIEQRPSLFEPSTSSSGGGESSSSSSSSSSSDSSIFTSNRIGELSNIKKSNRGCGEQNFFRDSNANAEVHKVSSGQNFELYTDNSSQACISRSATEFLSSRRYSAFSYNNNTTNSHRSGQQQQTLHFPGKTRRGNTSTASASSRIYSSGGTVENVRGKSKRKDVGGYHYNICNQRRRSHNHNSCRSPCGIDLRLNSLTSTSTSTAAAREPVSKSSISKSPQLLFPSLPQPIQNSQFQRSLSTNLGNRDRVVAVDVISTSSINNLETTDSVRELGPKKLDKGSLLSSSGKKSVPGSKNPGPLRQKMDFDNSTIDEDSGHFENGTGSGSNGSTFSESNTPLSAGSGGSGSGGSLTGSGNGATGLLHDSRIEIAGGREIFSQNKTRVGRRVVRTMPGPTSLLDYDPNLLPSPGNSKGRRKLFPPASAFPTSLGNNVLTRYPPRKSPVVGNSHQGTLSSSNSTVWELQPDRKEFGTKIGIGSQRIHRSGYKHYGSCYRHAHKSGHHNHGQLRSRQLSYPSYDYYYHHHSPFYGFDHNRPPIPHHPTRIHDSNDGGLIIKETVFGPEVTSVEKSVVGYEKVVLNCDSVRRRTLENIPSSSDYSASGYDGDIVFDDIEDWEEGSDSFTSHPRYRMTELKSTSSTGKSPPSPSNCSSPSLSYGIWESQKGGSVEGDNEEKRKLSYTQIMESSSRCPSIQLEGNTSPSGYESEECSASTQVPPHPNFLNENKRLIGSLPIAEYEGSPRRYGLYRQPPGAISVPNDLDLMDLSSGTQAPLSSSYSFDSTTNPLETKQGISPAAQFPRPESKSSPNNGRLPGFPQRILTIHSNSEIKSGPQLIETGFIERTRGMDLEKSGGQFIGISNPLHGIEKVIESDRSPRHKGEGEILTTVVMVPGRNPMTTTSREQCDYLYEFSETRKVLEEFFHSPGRNPSGGGDVSPSDFDELDYTLRRQNGNSYVGQRLAGELCLGGVETESPKKPSRREVVMSLGLTHEGTTGESRGLGGSSPRLITFTDILSQPSSSISLPSNKTSPPDEGNRDVNDNDLDLETRSMNTETDFGETEILHQTRHPRNYDLSPETTDFDSNELESEMSLDYEVSIHSSSRVGATMPVLEDGLSSGNVSENDEGGSETKHGTGEAGNTGNLHDQSSSNTSLNPTLLLMKKQISEIEKEIQMRATTTTGAQYQPTGITSSNGMSMTTELLLPPSSIPLSSSLPDPSHGETSVGEIGRGDSSSSTSHNANMKVHEVPHCDRRSNSSSLFDSNDPELEALDPMRPTPPPSPAPISAILTMSSSSTMAPSSLRPSRTLSPGRPCGLSLATTTNNSCNGILLSSSGTHHQESSSEPIQTPHQHQHVEPLKLISSIMTPPDSTKEPIHHHHHHHHHRNKQYQLPKFDSTSFTSLLPKPCSLTMTTGVPSVCPTQPEAQDESPQSELHESSSEERLGPHGNRMSPVWVPRRPLLRGDRNHHGGSGSSGFGLREPFLRKRYEEIPPDDDADTDQETDRLLGQHRTDDDYGFCSEKEWKKTKLRGILPSSNSGGSGAKGLSSSSFSKPTTSSASSHVLSLSSTTTTTTTTSTTTNNHSTSSSLSGGLPPPGGVSPSTTKPTPPSLLSSLTSSQPQPSSKHLSLNSPTAESSNFSELPLSLPSSSSSSSSKPQKEKDGVKKKRNKEDLIQNPSVLIEGVLFRARYLGSTQLISEGQPTKATRMLQAEEAVSRIKAQTNRNGPALSDSTISLFSSSSSSLTLPLVLTSDTTTTDDDGASPPKTNVKEVFPFIKSPLSPPSISQGQSPSKINNNGTGESTLDDRAGVETDDKAVTTTLEFEDRAGLDDDGFEFDSAILLQSPSDSCKSHNNSSSSDGSLRGKLRIQQVLPSLPTSYQNQNEDNFGGSPTSSPFHYCPPSLPSCGSSSGVTGTLFHLRFVGSLEVDEEIGAGSGRQKRPKKAMVEDAVIELKAPEGETQPSTEVDLFISTEKIMVLNTDLKEIMMDHALRTISYIADIGDLVVLMARRRPVPTDTPEELSKIHRPPKMICHVFESDEAQYIAQSIGQAFQVAYMEFLKANGIEDHSFVREMDYQEVLNSQEIFGDELQMFAKKELQKDVVVPKAKGEILGVVIVESGWGSMLPTVVIANLAPAGAAARCGQLNIGDQIIAINGVSLVGLPLSTCQTYIKNSKTQTVVKLTVVPCPPVVEVKIKRPDTKYQLGFSVQNGVICSLLRGGIAERGGVRVGHRIIEINNQSVVAVPHEKIVNLLATSIGEINMKTMPTSMFRLLTGQETPLYI